MNAKSGLGVCDWISWLIGIVAGILAYWASVAAVTWLPALLIGVAVGCFVALVLSNLLCRTGAESSAQDDAAAVAPEAGRTEAAEEPAPSEARDETRAPSTAEPAAEAAQAPSEPAAEAAETPAAPTSDTATGPASAGGGEMKSTLLAGEQELAARKGSWTYQHPDDAAQETGEAAPTGAGAATTPDYDQDGVLEGENEGTRPEALAGPRGGKADNLKEIKGIGPKLEALCNTLGFYHFDQIAGWSADEVAWVNANLQGFKGRVSRDDWVAQAKILAAGGETEFSARVDKGEVY